MIAVVMDQCEFGLMSRNRWGEAPAKKPTKFLTNAYHVGRALDVRCQNSRREAKQQHRHVKLIGGRRAGDAQVYPQKLCEAMVTGMKNQMKNDEWNVVEIKVSSVQEKPPKHDEDEEEEKVEQWA